MIAGVDERLAEQIAGQQQLVEVLAHRLKRLEDVVIAIAIVIVRKQRGLPRRFSQELTSFLFDSFGCIATPRLQEKKQGINPLLL